MTNTELIAKIKAEIERQQKENVNYDENDSFASYCDHSTWLALESMLTFVSGLEKSEKSINPVELEKEIEEYFPESTFNTGFNYDDMQEIARHFAQWGAEHLKQ